jgi:hypothetical protein
MTQRTTAATGAEDTDRSVTPSPKPLPPSLRTTARILTRGHLTWLAWTWLVTAAFFTVALALIIRLGGELDSSLWQGAGASWQRYVIFAAGVTTLPTFLALFVGNGVTRAQLAASSTVSMVVVAAAGTVVVIAGFVAESLAFSSTGWPHVMDGGEPVGSGADLVVLGVRYLVLFCMWYSAGWLIGTGFYRYGVVGGIGLIVPFAIPVVLCELLVGQAAASINVDVLTDLVHAPAALGVIVGVGLVAMNATIARAFTSGVAVRS